MNTLLRAFLSKAITTGHLTIAGHTGDEMTVGDGTGPAIRLRFNTASAERAVALDPALKLGECYMEGEIDFEEGTVYDLIMLAYRNAGRDLVSTPWAKLMEQFRVAWRRFHQLNTRNKSRGNVHRHYDLSADLYRMFLDPDMQYSCAYFSDPQMDLTEAQLIKKRHIAAKMLMADGMETLDIGCGWGGMGLYLARVAGAKVTGVTLSDEQLAVAKRRVEAEHLAGRVEFRLQDYRDISESFDRIVSVGMFEHVGINHYDTFFRKSAQLLKKDGVMLLHTIGRADPPGATNPFIHKYIFPGGYIPALSEVMHSIEKSGLIATDIEILRLHYAETLKAWRETFMARRDEAKAIYDEAFCRMWEFYLAGSEATFREGGMVVFQIQLAHRVENVPITRDYIAEGESRLARLEDSRGIPAPAWPEDWPELAQKANRIRSVCG
ncbi:SAM-dependent methyltransferase [Paracoccus aminophilus]|uniref:Cyclopropane-fatty-acyl-phospholipid synthase n=1 Tax=Paracoccus aminophilus JCM 7686 TaxID=1367847 RepID=S5XYH4_PARAH|nr:cyclopropane-fatty-acyl-phospholipid synthase family protein [Paracoccus aminophilus]AGT10362.1 cyclopropane-fatty-acyl-phospholipid synthase [Paracoccus aminophilus JCM 7686]